MIRELFTSLKEREKRKEIHVINQKNNNLTHLNKKSYIIKKILTIKNIKEKHMI